jgi:hypothetical protein
MCWPPRSRRRGPEFLARRISGVAIFPCKAGRDDASELALAAALDKGGAERVTRLYRHDDVPEDQCWLRRAGLVSGVPLMRPTFHILPVRVEEAAALSDLCFRSKAVWGYDAGFMALKRDAAGGAATALIR